MEAQSPRLSDEGTYFQAEDRLMEVSSEGVEVRDRRWFVSWSRVLVAIVAVCVTTVGIATLAAVRTSVMPSILKTTTTELKKKHYEFGSCASGGPWEDGVSQCEVYKTASGATTKINELVVDTGKYSPYLFQAYASWRHLQNGVIGAALGGVYDGVDDVKVSVTSRIVKKTDTLSAMLSGEAIPAGTVVFFDVIGNVGVSRENLVEALTSDEWNVGESSLTAGCDQAPWNKSETTCLDDIDSKCVYLHTEDVLLRLPILRRLLSYPKPLALIISGDIACRLRLPYTHHRILLANDGGCSQAREMSQRGADVHAWPQGLEDITEIADAEAFASVVKSAVAVEHAGGDSATRDVLIAGSFSYYFRKPARVALDKWLRLENGAEQLETYGAVSFEDEVNTGANVTNAWTYGLKYPVNAANRTLFMLCPAGDIWSSGRILESMLLGAVPIVDATYETDGGKSAKGCHDPAEFFRESGAPFLFISKWDDLPSVLAKAVADPASLPDRAAQVFTYARMLARRARAKVLDFAISGANQVTRFTQCMERPLNASEWHAIQRNAAEYYSSTSENDAWFHAYVDNPSVPGCGCSKKDDYALNGAYCFDAACAPPLVADFYCVVTPEEKS